MFQSEVYVRDVEPYIGWLRCNGDLGSIVSIIKLLQEQMVETMIGEEDERYRKDEGYAEYRKQLFITMYKDVPRLKEQNIVDGVMHHFVIMPHFVIPAPLCNKTCPTL